MVSLKEIARDVGVSTATVSNALTGKGRVSEDLGNRIRRRAQEMGYRPSSAARALKSGRSAILGLVMPDLTNPLFPRLAQSLATAAEAQGLGVLIGDSRGSVEHQNEAIRRLVHRGVEGLMVVPQRGTSPAIANNLPAVIINTASDPRNSVSSDHVGGGALIGAHIAGLGHRRVILLGGQQVSEVQQDRIRGMLRGLGPEVETEILWATESIAALPGRIAAGATAILATSDLVALEAGSELMRAGLSVPADVSLTGFDDLPFAQVMHPPLTSTAQDMTRIAERALSMLTAMISGAHPAQGETVAVSLVIRHSTAPPRS